MEALPRIPCDVDPSCKYFETGCREDVHHLFQNGPLRTVVESVFRDLPENKIQTCRVVHEMLERDGGWLPFPPLGDMRRAIIESDVFLSRRKRKHILEQDDG